MLNSTEPDHAPKSARGGLVSIPRRLGYIGIAAWLSNEPLAASRCVCGYVLVRVRPAVSSGGALLHQEAKDTSAAGLKRLKSEIGGHF